MREAAANGQTSCTTCQVGVGSVIMKHCGSGARCWAETASAHCASTYLEEGGKQRGHGLRVLDLLPHLWHARVRSRRWSGISSM